VTRSFALLGAGEFHDWHDEVDRWLLARAGGSGRVLIAPTAAAPEGEEVFDRWATMGLEHYARLDVPATVLPLKTREDAERDDVVAMLDDASIVFFSGGNPWYLATVLEGTAVWQRLRERLDDGLAYAGCSAGVACLADMTYDSNTQDPESVFKQGLGYVPGALFAPHWDIVDTWIPGARDFITASSPDGGVLVALDEDTAMVGDGGSWTVHGRQGIHLYREATWTSFLAGDTFELELVP
jgi:cyanophycinase-like exopeptidase